VNDETESSNAILFLAGVAMFSAFLAMGQFLLEGPVNESPVSVAAVKKTEPEAQEKATSAAPPGMKVEAAVASGKVETVNRYLEFCKKSKNCDLDAGLRAAVESDRPEITKVLLAAGANANTRDRAGETPLHKAAEKGSTAATLALLGAGAKVNALDEEGATPLHSAAAWGHVELARALLDAGAEIDALDGDRETALHLVAGRRIPPLSVYADVAKLLINAGASVNVRAADGTTPLEAAKAAASRVCLEGNRKACADANEVVAMLRGSGGSERAPAPF
jgi:hypothetical protein